MLGIGLLAVLAYIMLVIGKRLPMRPFFLVSSLIVFYLSVKFTGLGIHSLQLAGVIPSTTLTIPSISFLALYPSWQSMVPQLLLVLAAVAVVVWRQWQHRKHVAPSQ
jgi:high-affinity iron transporter